MLFHASMTKKLNEEELKEQLDFYLKIAKTVELNIEKID